VGDSGHVTVRELLKHKVDIDDDRVKCVQLVVE
jgi:hypothetical protein